MALERGVLENDRTSSQRKTLAQTGEGKGGRRPVEKLSPLENFKCLLTEYILTHFSPNNTPSSWKQHRPVQYLVWVQAYTGVAKGGRLGHDFLNFPLYVNK